MSRRIITLSEESYETLFETIETMQERTFDPEQLRRLSDLQKDIRETTVEQLTKKPK